MAKLSAWFKIAWAALTSGTTQKFYDRISTIYDDVFVDHRIHAEAIVGILKEIYADRESQTLVLDLGCGTGMLSRMLAENGFMVVGLDISFESLRVLKLKDPPFVVAQADAEKLPVAGSCYQSIVCLGVWRHFANPDRVLDEIARTLAPEGTFIVGYFPPKIAGAVQLGHGVVSGLISRLYRWVTGILGYQDRADFALEVETKALIKERFESLSQIASGKQYHLLVAKCPFENTSEKNVAQH